MLRKHQDGHVGDQADDCKGDALGVGGEARRRKRPDAAKRATYKEYGEGTADKHEDHERCQDPDAISHVGSSHGEDTSVEPEDGYLDECHGEVVAHGDTQLGLGGYVNIGGL